MRRNLRDLIVVLLLVGGLATLLVLSLRADAPLPTSTPTSVASIGPPPAAKVSPPAPASPLVQQSPSTTGQSLSRPATRWRLSNNRGTIKGFANKVSASNGETVSLFVTTLARFFDIEVYRLGWYENGTDQAELVQVFRNQVGIVQPQPEMDRQTGLISSSNWSKNSVFEVSGWRTGLYVLKLVAEDGDDNYIPLVVRDEIGKHDFVFQHASFTDQAYNNWGGKSLYDFNSSGANTVGGTKAAVKVAFDRPYEGNGAGRSLLIWELNMVRWLEANGFDVAYISDLDVHQDSEIDSRARAVLQVGHNEYWSKEERDHLESARDRGKGLGFFTGDSGVWAVRFEDSALGRNRVEVCYRDPALDPVAAVEPSRTTTEWKDPPLNRPTHQFIGVGSGGGVKRSADWVVEGVDSAPTLFANTGFQSGDVVLNLVGYEYDGLWTPGAAAGAEVSAGVRILGRARVNPSREAQANGRAAEAHTVALRAPNRGLIVAVGTIQWSWALDGYGRHADDEGRETPVDPRIQALTRNILEALRGTQ